MRDPLGWIIDDRTTYLFLDWMQKDKSTGLVRRNYDTHPSGCYAVAPSAPADWLVPPAEQQARLDAQVANKGSLFDLREANYDVLKSLDQNGYGLCWAFSTTKAVMYLRAIMNEPAVRLSAWWVAGKVKGWRDQGGWGAESLTEIATAGVPSLTVCPSYSRQFDTPAVAADAGQRKVIEWYDGGDDRALNTQIMISAFLLGLPPVLDFNWWSHSVCGCRLVSLNPLTIDIDNSWGESAGNRGIFRLTGSKAIPDGIVVPRVTQPAA